MISMFVFPVGLAYMAKLIIAWPLTFLLLIAGSAFAFGCILQISAVIFAIVLVYVLIRTCTNIGAPELAWMGWIIRWLARQLDGFVLKGAADVANEQPTDKPLIYAYHPHGLYAVAPLVHTLRQDISASLVTLPIAANFPVLSILTRQLGITSSDKENLRTHLRDGKSIAILIGGVREAEEATPRAMRLFAERTGIFELAIETGATIIPVMSYGENEIFRPWKPLGWFQDILKKVAHIKVILPHLGDIWGLLTNGCPRVDTYMGDPIYVGEGTYTVSTLREKYKSALNDLYVKTKPPTYECAEIEWLK